MTICFDANVVSEVSFPPSRVRWHKILPEIPVRAVRVEHHRGHDSRWRWNDLRKIPVLGESIPCSPLSSFLLSRNESILLTILKGFFSNYNTNSLLNRLVVGTVMECCAFLGWFLLVKDFSRAWEMRLMTLSNGRCQLIRDSRSNKIRVSVS